MTMTNTMTMTKNKSVLYCPNIYTMSKLQKNARKTVKYSTCSAEKGFYEGKVS